VKQRSQTTLTKYLLRRRGNKLPQKIRLLERELLSQFLGESQNENWYGLENEEKEKADQKMNCRWQNMMLSYLSSIAVRNLWSAR